LRLNQISSILKLRNFLFNTEKNAKLLSHVLTSKQFQKRPNGNLARNCISFSVGSRETPLILKAEEVAFTLSPIENMPSQRKAFTHFVK